MFFGGDFAWVVWQKVQKEHSNTRNPLLVKFHKKKNTQKKNGVKVVFWVFFFFVGDFLVLYFGKKEHTKKKGGESAFLGIFFFCGGVFGVLLWQKSTRNCWANL